MAPVVSSAWLPPWTDQVLPGEGVEVVLVRAGHVEVRRVRHGRDVMVGVLVRGLVGGLVGGRRGGEAAVAVGGADVADDDAVAVVPALHLALGLAVLREPAELGDRLPVGEVVHGVDDVALGGEPLLDPVEAGQAAGVVVDLAVEAVEVVVVGAGLEDELAADHGCSWTVALRGG